MKKVFAIIITFLACATAYAQSTSGTVKGIIKDSSNTSALADATISVVNAKDSSLISFTLTSNSGFFEIKNLAEGPYHLLVSYQGYRTLRKPFSITKEQPVADLGNVTMDNQYTTLQEVIVTDVAPIRINGDTVEYRADAFKTKPNATVEDLLKKLPGVQVERDGQVKAMGENVQRVFVDGKEFFGDDPKLATKNLTADMVESIQVYDDMSEQAKFTRIDDGSRSKAINIKLKKDKKHGMFGRANAGYGTQDRYDANVSINKFNGPTQMSFIGAANNVNKQGFSFSDVVSMMGGFGSGGGFNMGGSGGGGGMMGGGQMTMGSRTGGGNVSGAGAFGMGGGNRGITSSLSGGFNYRDIWGPKIDVNGSIFASRANNNLQQNSLRQNFFPNDSITRDITSRYSNNLNNNIRANFRFEYRIDSLNSLLYTPNVVFQHSDGIRLDSTVTSAIIKSNPAYVSLISENESENIRDGINLNQNLLYRRRFKRAGRTLTIGLNNTLNNSDGSGHILAPITTFLANGDPLFSRSQNQQQLQTTRGNNNVVSASYTEPVGLNKLMEFNYAYTNNFSTSDRKAFEYNTSTGKYDMLVAPQTNYFENTFLAHRVGTNFRVQQKKYNYQLGMGVQMSDLSSRSILAMFGNKDTTYQQSFINLFPTASFNYNFTRSKSIRFNYRGRTNQPNINQLQNVPDFSNPLQVRTGNPDLKQEFINNFNFTYNTFNFMSFRYFATNFSFSQTNNKIANSIDSFKLSAMSPTVQLNKPVNLDGAYMATGFVAVGLPIRGIKGSNLNFNTIGVFNRDVSIIYKQKNFNDFVMLTQSAAFNYNYKEKFDMGVSGSLTYNNIKYSLQPVLNNEFFSQTYSADVSYTMPGNFILGVDFDYFINSGRADGFNQNIPMWNASLAKQLFKKKNAEIRFSVNDILNQNQSVVRNTGENFFEDIRSNVLQRYFMLSFSYNINKMAGKTMTVPKMMERGMRNMRVN